MKVDHFSVLTITVLIGFKNIMKIYKTKSDILTSLKQNVQQLYMSNS